MELLKLFGLKIANSGAKGWYFHTAKNVFFCISVFELCIESIYVIIGKKRTKKSKRKTAGFFSSVV